RLTSITETELQGIRREMYRNATTVEQLTSALRRGTSPEEASRILSEAGIPGIKYFDKVSRFAEQDAGKGLADVRSQIAQIERDVAAERERGVMLPAYSSSREAHLNDLRTTEQRLQSAIDNRTRNYVIFDDAHVEITHKNGESVEPPMSGPARAMA